MVGDITKQNVDVVVNAANSSLLGGGGVDGAIHRSAGSELVHACRLLGGCKTGEAKITKGFQLQARWIVHTVGPVWRGGSEGEPELLAACYRRSLEEAAKVSARTIAFPSISTGIYGYPIDLASKVAIEAVQAFDGDLTVRFVAFSQEHFDVVQGLVRSARDPRLPSGLFRTATNLDQLVALADTLRLESCDPNCSWKNPTLERFEEALVAWLDDVRFGPLVKRNLGRTLPDSCWLAVRAAVQSAQDSFSRSIAEFLETFDESNLAGFREDEFWLLSNSMIAATIYE